MRDPVGSTRLATEPNTAICRCGAKWDVRTETHTCQFSAKGRCTCIDCREADELTTPKQGAQDAEPTE